MKAITIKQPWATLIAEGYKEYEFRTWKTKYRGEIYIHAGKGIDKAAMERFKDLNLHYEYGCIIAKAQIADCLEVNENFRKQAKNENELVYYNIIKDHSWQGYAFKLEKVKKIKPIKAIGKLSLWEYNPNEK